MGAACRPPASAVSALRPTVEEDLPALSAMTQQVFGRRRSEELLRWLLLSRAPGLELASRVVERHGRLVGHAAVVESHYGWCGRSAVGAHPYLWMVAPAARGRPGVVLGRWNLGHGDFSLVVGGTPSTRAVLARRRFTAVAEALELRLPTAAVKGGGAGAFELTPYEPEAASEVDERSPVANLPSPAHLRWLAACPELEARLFTLRRRGAAVGPLLLFIDRRRTPPGGRIVHLPWLPEGWRELLGLATAELAAAGCATASLLTTSPTLAAAAAAVGGELFYRRPVWVREATDLPRPDGWHLTYLEGDLGYRNV